MHGRGINWFDTAATYGDGQSNGPRCRFQLRARDLPFTLDEVRVMPEENFEISKKRKEIVRGSLRVSAVIAYSLATSQSITRERGDQPTSIPHAMCLARRCAGRIHRPPARWTHRPLRPDGLGDIQLARNHWRGPWASVQLALISSIHFRSCSSVQRTDIGVIASGFSPVGVGRQAPSATP